MSQFTLSTLWAHMVSLFESCSVVSNAKRQEESRKKLEEQKTFLTFSLKQLDKEVEEMERRKTALLQQRRGKEAKEVVRAKFGVLKKYEKTRELLTFVGTMHEQITNTATMADTVATINEAQRVFTSIDHATIHKRYAKLSEKFGAVQEQVAETQDLMSERMSFGSSLVDDSELLAELESCDAPMPLAPMHVELASAAEPQAASSITTAYSRAGLHT